MWEEVNFKICNDIIKYVTVYIKYVYKYAY